MIRFIDLSYQIGPIIEFAWFDTVPGRFLAFDSFQAWNTWEEFLYAYNAHYGPKPDLARLERLFPEDWGVPKQELPALMSRAIIATTQCDHDWHNPHITGERDFYDQGLHQAILTTTCRICDGWKQEVWKTPLWYYMGMGDEVIAKEET